MMNIQDFCWIECWIGFDGSAELLNRLAEEINPDADYSYIDVLCKDWDIKDLAELVSDENLKFVGNFAALIESQLTSDDLIALFNSKDKANEIVRYAALKWAYAEALTPISETLAAHVLNS